MDEHQVISHSPRSISRAERVRKGRHRSAEEGFARSVERCLLPVGTGRLLENQVCQNMLATHPDVSAEILHFCRRADRRA